MRHASRSNDTAASRARNAADAIRVMRVASAAPNPPPRLKTMNATMIIIRAASFHFPKQCVISIGVAVHKAATQVFYAAANIRLTLLGTLTRFSSRYWPYRSWV
jgi:hypothetical protein